MRNWSLACVDNYLISAALGKTKTGDILDNFPGKQLAVVSFELLITSQILSPREL